MVLRWMLLYGVLLRLVLGAAGQFVETTSYLVDGNNLSGYAQVVEACRTTDAGGTTRTHYTYGAELLRSVALDEAGAVSAERYYLYDGGGSVRELTDETGALTDTYDYDAFGVLVQRTGTTENPHLYRGEQWDQDLGLYYNRARYLNTDSGRFWNQDNWEGERREPTSLHKYLYASANPVTGFDPSGYFTLFEITLVQIIDGIKNTISVPVSAYARRKGIKTLTCVVGVSAAERWMDYEFSVEGHHPIPKSHGGAEDQVLLFLPANTHRAFHFIYNVFLKGDKQFAALGLHNSSPAADWEEAFKRNPALKKSALGLLKKAARLIDKKCSLPKAFGLETFISKNERRWLRGG